jgi:hypothetical protein
MQLCVRVDKAKYDLIMRIAGLRSRSTKDLVNGNGIRILPK